MANQFYGYSSPSPSASTLHRYLDSDAASQSQSHLLQQLHPSAAAAAAAAASLIKRPSQVLYHQNVLDAQNTLGQIEAWYSASSLVKRPRLESASNLPIYPQRPGEKDCAHYMLTRTCKFGDSCKFDHPIWVPEGGIPYWKEVTFIAIFYANDNESYWSLPIEITFLWVPPVPAGESLPERPGEPDCPYFLKTQRCKFGSKCKFNHPKDKLDAPGDSENLTVSGLPERPSEPPCAFYMKTGTCKFGSTCKFNHPKDIQIQLSLQNNVNCEQSDIAMKIGGISGDIKPALYHNSKGLPVRPDEVDCPFYLKTGRYLLALWQIVLKSNNNRVSSELLTFLTYLFNFSCKYGSTCRYNHPDRNAFVPPVALGHSLIASASNLNIGVVNPASSLYQTIDPRLSQTTLLAQQTMPTVMRDFMFHDSHLPPGGSSFLPLIIGGKGTQQLIAHFSGWVCIYSKELFEAVFEQRILAFTIGSNAELVGTQPVYPQRPGQTECDVRINPLW
ncbi:hypothetical protein Gotur_023225, partial [Gossypium turneri]